MNRPQRIYPQEIKDPRNENIIRQYDADNAAWLWHPACNRVLDGSMVEFTLEVDVESAFTEECTVSADNRYELYLDGNFISMGPDRGDVDHWAFAALPIAFSAGHHILTARCWFYPGDTELMPLAQLMSAPGFLFGVKTEERRAAFNTGNAPWKVRKIEGVGFGNSGWAVGYGGVFDVKTYDSGTETVEPVVQCCARFDNIYGGKVGDKRLCPSNLPEQIRRKFDGKITVRAVMEDSFPENGQMSVSAESTENPDREAWQRFFDGSAAEMVVDANVKLCVLLDFNTYLCAYCNLGACGGDGDARVEVMLAESLQSDSEDYQAKGNRSEVAGKIYPVTSMTEKFWNFDGKDHDIMPFWWKAGRYAMIRIKTGAVPLTLKKLDFIECRYPIEQESTFVADDDRLNRVQPMLIRALQSCMHETYMDCPFYEQLMYVGDTRLEILTTYCVAKEARLPLRALHLFDWSRSVWDGVVAEHYPGRGSQLSCTFSAIWTLLVRDYMMYRRFDSDAEFLHLRRSVRTMLIALGEYVNGEGVIEDLPGWSFVDWIDEWNTGIPHPKKNKGKAAIFSMHYLLSLRAAIELETMYLPEANNGLAAYYQTCFDRTAQGVKNIFWVEDEKLFADEESKEHFSMHAQCMALLAGVLTGDEAKACCDAMLNKKNITVPTLYFIHYLFDTLQKFGIGEKILDYMPIWTDMQKKGAVTTWERPEPTRSDCHAWGAHLYYHYFSTLAGIRPASAGFKTITLQPRLGTLKEIKGSLVHPDGMIDFNLTNEGNGKVSGTITLPDGVSGTYGNVMLKPGLNTL